MEKQKYVIYPHELSEKDDLKPADKLIYLTIRRYINTDKMTAFPSYSTITRDCGASTRVILKSIANLVKAGYITIHKEGRRQIYTFNNKKHFEPFSYEFLDRDDLTFNEKAYIVASAQYMYKTEDEGIISYSNKQHAKLINVSESTVSRTNHALEKKEVLKCADDMIKRFQLRKLDLAILYKLGEHDELINQNTEDIEGMKKEIALLREELAQYKKDTYKI